MAYTVEADSIAVAWIKAVLYVFHCGNDIPTEYENNARTLSEPIAVHINKPSLEPKTCDELSPIKSRTIAEYCEKFLKVEKTGHSYTYPNRLFDYPGILDDWEIGDGNGDGYNQIDQVVFQLRNNRITRRAMAHTWVPTLDSHMEHCPCLQDVQFSILDGKLRLNAHFRSNDMLDAALSNYNGLHTLQKYVANLTGVECGYIEVYSGFPHIYVNRLDDAKIVAEGAGKFISYAELERMNNVD